MGTFNLQEVRNMMTNLEYWRRCERLTQKAVAERLGPGFSEAVISLLETGRLKPSDRQRDALQAFFGPEAERLLDQVPASALACLREIGGAR
jgi:transcriptional regulator with XRE-family HTH domain